MNKLSIISKIRVTMTKNTENEIHEQ